ncbi:hypothetical protein CLV59_105127 [Chitinophaga dinghuensis]|uniref:Uncharacterized protein n=1 Tax=Chitinophaga dinghuensis TaxID=1539050 RepID=A0A327VXU9_9BACT|nr:hypothetical protein [Chitinophaga dinghuensis]RAJ80020.1 hypothetical protein CLV59_105127 [Chitinophaga dinghuensis]
MPLPTIAVKRQPWIYSGWVDGLFILFPPFAALLAIWLFPAAFQVSGGVNLAWWVILVLFIDVSHVYSTIYRTYFDGDTFQKRRRLFIAVPIISWIAGVLAYLAGPLVFWRILAYLAVYHFVRQQYGFLRIYSRKENAGKWSKTIDSITIYAATIYPLLYWHLHGPRLFNWFVENDFYYISGASVADFLRYPYAFILITYVINAIRETIISRSFNTPKHLLVLGTVLSWYFGIIYFNGDLTFTLLNVISHGIPYMALIWAHGRKQYYRPAQGSRFLQLLFSNKGIVLFIGLTMLFAYVEEGLWDGFVWREHLQFFSLFRQLPAYDDNYFLAFIIPFLAIPQVTHYVLDGFIWKIKNDRYNWKEKTIGA